MGDKRLQDDINKKRRRSIRNDSEYHRNAIKQSLIGGKAYVSYKGVKVPAKEVGTTCRYVIMGKCMFLNYYLHPVLFRCALNCFNKLSAKRRKSVFDKFYNLPTKDEQDIYLQGLIEAVTVKRKSEAGNSRRNNSFFIVIIDMDRVKVCQNIFLSLHACGRKRLARIKRLLVQGATPKDKRGHNPKTHAISEHGNIKIRQPISS